MLETHLGSRSGEDLRALVEHARRVKTLMTYVPKRYDERVVEALALTGGLDPALDGNRDRQDGAAKVAATPAPVTEEDMIAISAAVAAFLGVRARIRQVRLVHSSAWAQVGRMGTHASHHTH